VRERVIVADGAGRALPTVGHVARAVDEGRDRAAAAGAAGVTLLVVLGAGDPAVVGRVRAWLSGDAVEPAVRGPLGALWRLGDEELAVLCGVALGAGEQGLALLCAGGAGMAAAGLGVAVQPMLRARVRLVGVPDASWAALELPAVLGAGEGDVAGDAVAVLRRACA
jgi:hypothetical protein